MLSSLQNPLIKEVRKLHRSTERRKQNLYLLEGTNLLTVATEVNYPLETVLATEVWISKNSKLWSKLEILASRVELVTPELMEKLATTVHPDGVVATACRRENIPITSDNFDCGLVLEKIQDPGNLGTIIRTTVATDVDFLWLSEDCVDLDNPKVLRSSVGEWFKVKAQKHGNLVDLVQEYRNKNVQVVATSLEATKSHWDIDWTQPTIILLGNESQGLSTELESLATQKVKIPLANDVESLNVAIATAFILAEYQRQRKYQ